MRKENFITKIATSNFNLGSFDVYLEEVLKLLIEHGYSKEDAILKIFKMPSLYRAAIVKNGKDSDEDRFMGYIGITNVNFLEGTADLDFEITKTYPLYRQEIIYNYLKYLKDTLNISYINNLSDYFEENKAPKKKQEIVLPRKFVREAATKEDYEIVKSWNFEVPNLSYARRIVINSKFVGLIGLTNISAPDKRATLCFYLNPELGYNLISQFGHLIIDEYLEYAHSLNFYNIESCASDNTITEQLLTESRMKKCIMIPFGNLDGDLITTKNIFQSVPNIEKIEGFGDEHYYPTMKINSHSIYDFMFNKIPLSNGFSLIRPREALHLGLDLEHLVDGYIRMLQDRKLASSIGEDKYILEKGNIYKKVLNLSYILVDDFGNYAGFVNILETNGYHATINLSLALEHQNIDLGREVLEIFYNELFKAGYISISSQVFNFNEPLISLFEKVASFNGMRISSYYANNHLYDIYYYTKVRDDLRDAIIKEEIKGIV